MKKRFCRGAFALLSVLALLFGAVVPAVAAGIDGTVELTPAAYVNWIDRLDLSHEDAAPLRAFYDRLIEGADNDGNDDFLIDDHTAYAVDIATVNGTFTTESGESAGEKSGQVGGDILDRYKPFIMAVFDAFDRDHPEVFWLDGARLVSYSMTYAPQSGGTYSYTVTVSFVVQRAESAPLAGDGFDVRSDCYPDAASIKAAIAARETAISSILAELDTQNAYGILRYLNRKLTHINEYNTNLANAPADARECISALLGKTGAEGPVCEGYARALKVLCDRVGIPCVLVDGYAKTSLAAAGEAHMWNYVQLDDLWYGIDVTWNDPLGGAPGAVSGMESEDWFLHGSATRTADMTMTFATSHPVQNQASVGGVFFENGPVLSTSACADPGALPETVLGDVSVKNGAGADTDTVTYGQTLTVSVFAAAGAVKADTQTMTLYCNGVPLARSSAAVNGVYQLTYDTTARKIPAGEPISLVLQFAGDDTMASAMTTVPFTLAKAAPSVVFEADAQTAVQGTVSVTAPVITLFGEDAPGDGALAYSYENLNDNTDSGEGLPTEAGTYRITATLAESDWYLTASDTIILIVTSPPADTGEGGNGGSSAGGVGNLLQNGVDTVTDLIRYSTLRTVLIAFAALGILCILLAVLFGRKKSDR